MPSLLKPAPAGPPPRRVRTPTILQMQAAECGAAALAMVLAYYGRRVPLEELRLACGISRNGSKASYLLHAARSYGLAAQGFRYDLATLRTVKPPAILHWDLNHFVVLEGFSRDKVHLNDPAVGPRTITLAELSRSYSGVALTFEPGPDFVPGGHRPSLWDALRRRWTGLETPLAYVVLVSLALVIPGLVIPFFTQSVIDDYLMAGRTDWLVPLLVGMGLTAVLRMALTWLQQDHLARIETKLALVTSSRFFWHILHLPIEFYLQRFGGEIGARVGINDRVAQLLSGELATQLLNVAMIAFYAAVMVQYDPLLTAAGIASVAVNLAVLRSVSGRRADIQRRLLQQRGRVMGATLSGLQAIESVKAGGLEADLFARWSGYQAQVLNAQQHLGRYTHLLAVVPPFMAAMTQVTILSFGGLRVMQGSLTIGMWVAFQSLMAAFTGPVTALSNLGGTLQAAEADMNRLDDVLDYAVDSASVDSRWTGEPGGELAKLSGQLEVRDISFGYSRLESPLIEHVSLQVRPGARVALVGGSGSGKSTIAKIVCGLYEPWGGQVLVDDRPRAEWPRRLLAHSIAWVDQDVFVFRGTFRDNLTLWDAGVPEGDIVQAARDACLHDDIMARAGGYDGLVAEDARNFSGGQRQRLEIARALVGNPTLLVLDEATSALDPLTEKRIDDNLRRRGCSCLIVAHRLSTIRDCDEIVVLDHGRVVQRGTHDEMIRADGPYRRLVHSDEYQSDQTKSVLERLV